MKQSSCNVCLVESILDPFLQENDHCELFTGMRPETPNTIVRNNKFRRKIIIIYQLHLSQYI